MPLPNLRLKYERQQRGWSQVHLAEQIDVPDYYISRWERGEVLPSPLYQQRLCELLGKTAQELGFLLPVGETPLPGSLGEDETTSSSSVEQLNETPLPEILMSDESTASSSVDELNETPVSGTLRDGERVSSSSVDEPPEQLEFPFPEQLLLPSSSYEYSSIPQETRPSRSPFPSTPTPPPPLPPASRPHEVRPSWHPHARVWITLVVLFLFIGFGIFTASRVFHSLETPPISGQVDFLSSGQFNDVTNQGIADQVQVELNSLASPAADNSYYAWLLPDKNLPENPDLLLGKVVLKNGAGSLFYQDPQYTNLLATMSRFLITEENSSMAPLTPSADTSTWRYQARIPDTRPTAIPGEASYSLLDHVRHLLASDPTVRTHGLTGGLTKWLVLNTDKVSEWASAARGEWRPGGIFDTHLLKRHLTRILDYLDGTSFVWQDMPTTEASSVLVDPQVSSLGLLQFTPQQQPPGYLNHIEFHLHGLVSAPGANALQQKQAGQIEIAINHMNAWLQQAREDAKHLLLMTDTQLRQPEALTILNNLHIMAIETSSGKTDAVTGTFQQGVEQVVQDIEHLAVLDVMVYNR